MPHGNHEPNALLDPFLPTFDVHERHEVRVGAPASITWDAAQSMDFRRSRIVRAIFRSREWLMGSQHASPPEPRPFVEEARSLGWRPLHDEPGRALVMGAVTQPWLPDVVFRGMAPEAFVRFAEPGFVKLAWTLEVEPLGPSESRF
ncbi:MAG: hypothetical protein OEW19_12330, partial [Acidobacteriota bacterium]|nr:hypothetical protein [Acidobacteriota bacterium]